MVWRVPRTLGALIGPCTAILFLCTVGGCSTGSTCADSGCPTDQACVAGRCRTACQEDATCPNGEVCFRGYCELGDRRPAADGVLLSGDTGEDSLGNGDPDGGDPGSGDPGSGASDPGLAGCGNGTIDAGEACDGTALGALTTCAAAGWRDGTIGCMATCVLHDLSGCIDAPGNCNGTGAAGRQQCDGQELRGETCQSLGFVDGTLGCTSDCAYDVSGCSLP